MRRISFALALALSFACISFAQQPSEHAPATATPNGSILPPGPVLGGDGTPYYIPIWRTNSYLLSSVMYQNGSSIGVGTQAPATTLDVNGGINAATTYSLGGKTLLSATAPGNLALGIDTGQGGSFNTFLGWDAGTTNQGAFNVFVGASPGWRSPGGENNIGIGYQAGLTVGGNGNVMIGGGAGGQVTIASNNTLVGNNAGPYLGTGSGNTYLGSGAGSGETSHTGSNNIFINHAGTPYDTGTIRIGDGRYQTSAYIAGVYHATVLNNALPVYVDSNGELGTMASSLRYKEQVRDMGGSTDALMRLRPVTFFYKAQYSNGERTLQYGLIAEEVAKVYPELVAYDSDGQPYSVRYQYLSTMLLNEVQKQYQRAEAEAKVIGTQEQKIEELEQRLTRLEEMVHPR